MKKHKDYLGKAKRGEMDRAVNAVLKLGEQSMDRKSNGEACFVFGLSNYKFIN